MKKIVVLLLAAMILSVLAGCKSAPETSGETTAETTAAELPPPVTECTHSYTETVETEPKALTEGMKKFTCSACGDSYTESIPATGSLKILAIGNSFSVDAMEYLWDIAKDGGVEEVILGNLYIGGCSLNKHASNMADGSSAYTYYKNYSGKWYSSKEASIMAAVGNEEWDIVTIQQASGSSGVASTYEKLPEILAWIAEKLPNAKVYWHMTWAYQQNSTHQDFAKYNSDQMTMYNAILDALNSEVKTREDIVGVIPSGTAVQNLRSSYIGDTITRDGYHMSYDYGRYTTALTWYSYFTGAAPDTVSWLPDAYKATLTPHLPAIREAVTNALASPETVTESKAENPGAQEPQNDAEYIAALGHKIEDYTLLDWKQEVHAYYNSTSSKFFTMTSTANSTAKNLPNFIASYQYTKEQLPVGSIIIVDEGYQYRPEGWVDENTKNASGDRPANIKASAVEVTEEWWGNFTIRAFNLSHSPAKEMTEEDAAHLRIYVPKK